VQNHNPTFFKKVNDMCLLSDFKGKLDKESFMQIFLNSNLLYRDIELYVNPE